MEPVRVDRFAGINNRQPIDRLRLRADEAWPVRDAVNVDLSASSTFQSRPGYRRIIELAGGRYFFECEDGALFADGPTLKFFDGSSARDVATLASPHARVAYTTTPLGVVWSDGFGLHLFRGTSGRLLPSRPNPAPVVSASVGGSLVGGTYGVTCASVLSDGRQSPLTDPLYVVVPDGGQVNVVIAAQQDAVAVFVTAVDGELFYREAVIPAGQTAASVPLVFGSGQPVRYEVTGTLPPGKILGLYNGRLLSADDAFLYYSLPWEYGKYRPAFDYIALPEPITLVCPVVGGVYLATLGETFFLAGGDVAQATMQRVAGYGAVRGTLAYADNSIDPMWHTPRGPVSASQDGALTPLQDKQIAYPSAAAGASLFREENGLRQLITNLTQPAPTGAAVYGSFMEARVIQGAST